MEQGFRLVGSVSLSGRSNSLQALGEVRLCGDSLVGADVSQPGVETLGDQLWGC